jgi:hypothetical protein
MEDSNNANQDKSELDLSCCFSSKFMLPSSLLEDDEEFDNQNYEISLKRNMNPQKKYSSSTCISAVSNNSSQVFNRNLERSENFNNEVVYRNNLNQFGTKFLSGNMMANELTNNNTLNSNEMSGDFSAFKKYEFQKKKTFSYLENKHPEIMESKFENFDQNYYSPQMYPSNFQENIYSNLKMNKNNMDINFANLYRNNIPDNRKNNQYNSEAGNISLNSPHTSYRQIGFRKNPEDTLDIFHINRNNISGPNHISRRISQPINHSISQNPLNNNFPANFSNMANNPINQNVLFNTARSKKNNGYDIVKEMGKLDINNLQRKSVVNSNFMPKKEKNHRLIPPFTMQDSITAKMQPNQHAINPHNGLPQSLTPAFPPRKINIKEAIYERNDRKMNSHIQKNKLIFDTILEEPTENEITPNEINIHNFLKSMDGNFIAYLKTQKGSRAMQKFMNGCKMSSEFVENLFIKIYPHAKELMTDNYGNYFMQTLIQCCSGSQKMLLLKHVLKLLYKFYLHFRFLTNFWKWPAILQERILFNRLSKQSTFAKKKRL